MMKACYILQKRTFIYKGFCSRPPAKLMAKKKNKK